MSFTFPAPIYQLPRVQLPVPGGSAFLSQGEGHQVLFMSFHQDVVMPEHSHGAQVGFVVSGRIEMTVEGATTTYEKGDLYCIPEGAKHSAHIFAGYADITFFAKPKPFAPLEETPGEE